MKVQDVMHSGVTWVEPETPLKDIARKMRDEDIGAVPVGQNDRLVGMVTDRDIACRGLASDEDYSGLTAKDVMTKKMIYCASNEEIGDALRLMETHKIRRLPVINADKRMVGMLSLGDISGKVSQDLVGEVVRCVAEHHA